MKASRWWMIQARKAADEADRVSELVCHAGDAARAGRAIGVRIQLAYARYDEAQRLMAEEAQ